MFSGHVTGGGGITGVSRFRGLLIRWRCRSLLLFRCCRCDILRGLLQGQGLFSSEVKVNETYALICSWKVGDWLDSVPEGYFISKAINPGGYGVLYCYHESLV